MQTWKTCIFSLIICTNNLFAIPQRLDKIIAIVNKDIILESEFNDMINMTQYSTRKTSKEVNDTELRCMVLDYMILDSIIMQSIQPNSINISEQQIDQIIKEVADYNSISTNQLYNSVAHIGINYLNYRAQIRREILINEVVNREVRSRITILPQEIDDLAQQINLQYEIDKEVNISQIFITLPTDTTQDQLGKAKMIADYLIEQIKNGADFDKLAVIYSNGSKYIKSNQIGWKKLKDLPYQLAVQLYNVQKGSIIGPIQSNIGFHILKINDIICNTQIPKITEFHARHILLRTSTLKSDEKVFNKLIHIYAQIKDGHLKFDIVAKQLSEDLDSASNGGDLGWIPANRFNPALRNVLMHLKKGEISKPIHSAFGWHLIQIIDTRQVDCANITDYKDLAYQLIFNRIFSKEKKHWIQEQRTSSYIKIIDND